MPTKQYVEFLATGDITWVSKWNLERRKHVHKGDRLHVRVVQQGDDYELWDGNWSVLMPAKNSESSNISPSASTCTRASKRSVPMPCETRKRSGKS